MEEIKVGEYVKTDKGYIVKIDKEKKNLQMLKFLNVEYGNILKHSKNIIDLIEEGDYVNGYKVKGIDKDGDVFIEIPFENNSGYRLTDKIKSIVTKKQFAQMDYKVKD